MAPALGAGSVLLFEPGFPFAPRPFGAGAGLKSGRHPGSHFLPVSPLESGDKIPLRIIETKSLNDACAHPLVYARPSCPRLDSLRCDLGHLFDDVEATKPSYINILHYVLPEYEVHLIMRP